MLGPFELALGDTASRLLCGEYTAGRCAGGLLSCAEGDRCKFEFELDADVGCLLSDKERVVVTFNGKLTSRIDGDLRISLADGGLCRSLLLDGDFRPVVYSVMSPVMPSNCRVLIGGTSGRAL